MGDHGYENIDGDGVTFVKEVTGQGGKKSKIIIGLHADDGIVFISDPELYEQLIKELKEEFELSSCGILEYYLGCKITQDLIAGTVTLLQEQYRKMC